MAEGKEVGLQKELSDIVECPICQEEISDNRVLPCIHTFCLKCLQSYMKSKPKSKALPCPVCAAVFQIPKGGLENLQRNFFIGKVIDARLSKKEEYPVRTICDICDDGKESTEATAYCRECSQNMCAECRKQHRKITATISHFVEVLSSEGRRSALFCRSHQRKELELYCHDCGLSICWQCRALSHVNHNCEDISKAVEQIKATLQFRADELKSRIDSNERNIETLASAENYYTKNNNLELEHITATARNMIKTIMDNEERLRQKVEAETRDYLTTIRQQIYGLSISANQMIFQDQRIDQMKHTSNSSDFCSMASDILAKTDEFMGTAKEDEDPVSPSVREISLGELRQRLLRTDKECKCKNRIFCAKEDVDPVSPSVREIFLEELRQRLLSTENESRCLDGDTPEPMAIDQENFTLPESVKCATSEKKLRGKLSRVLSLDDRKPLSPKGSLNRSLKCQTLKEDVETEKKPNSTRAQDDNQSQYDAVDFVHEIIMEDGKAACGVTVLDDRIYVISEGSCYIRVYRTTDFQPDRRIFVDSLQKPNDLASCNVNKCLYVCDWGPKCIHRIEVVGEKVKTKWSTEGDFGSLSVTHIHNAIFAGHESRQIKEFTTHGQLIRSYRVGHVLNPWHAVQLDSGDLLVCGTEVGSSACGVCLINSEGKVKHLFNGAKGTKAERLDGTYNLAVYNKQDSILAIDCNYRRILLLSKNLEFVKELVQSSSKQLRRPRRLCLDEANQRLYVTDNAIIGDKTSDGKIIVFSLTISKKKKVPTATLR